MPRPASSLAASLGRASQEEHDSRDHDVCENMRDPWSEHAASASPNDSQEQAVNTSEANADPAARKPPYMDRPERKGLQKKSRESGSN